MLKAILNAAKFILSPPYCEGCFVALSDRFIFCANCYSEVKPVTTYSLQVTNTCEAKVFAVANYEYPLKKLILAKHASNMLAAEYIADLIWQNTAIKYVEFDCIVPIPLHWSRKMKRGYNQAEAMAEKISTFSCRPVINALTRKKITSFQSKLNQEERDVNIKNCFGLADISNLEGKRVLLVDDLMTSGATLKYASKALLRAGVDSITIAVGCRVV